MLKLILSNSRCGFGDGQDRTH